MAKLGENISFQVGEDGLIELRQPTNREWNQYVQDKNDSQASKRDQLAVSEIVCAMFDKLVINIVNIFDKDDTEINLQNLQLIEDQVKIGIVGQAIDYNDQGITRKN